MTKKTWLKFSESQKTPKFGNFELTFFYWRVWSLFGYNFFFNIFFFFWKNIFFFRKNIVFVRKNIFFLICFFYWRVWSLFGYNLFFNNFFFFEKKKYFFQKKNIFSKKKNIKKKIPKNSLNFSFLFQFWEIINLCHFCFFFSKISESIQILRK